MEMYYLNDDPHFTERCEIGIGCRIHGYDYFNFIQLRHEKYVKGFLEEFAKGNDKILDSGIYVDEVGAYCPVCGERGYAVSVTPGVEIT
jgi:hypothetical protein